MKFGLSKKNTFPGVIQWVQLVQYFMRSELDLSLTHIFENKFIVKEVRAQ